MKRKYTREQLEFYFKKLMAELKRIPTIDDLKKNKKLPSLTVYKQRFGSWTNVVKKLAPKDINRITCKQCGTITLFKKKTKQFCSSNCAHQYKMLARYRTVKPKQCVICSKDFRINEVSNFRKRKICTDPTCKEKFSIVQSVKKNNKLSTGITTKLIKGKGNKCKFCDFTKVLSIVTKGRHTNQKLINMIKKRNFDYVVVCPNHQAMLKRKMVKL